MGGIGAPSPVRQTCLTGSDRKKAKTASGHAGQNRFATCLGALGQLGLNKSDLSSGVKTRLVLCVVLYCCVCEVCGVVCRCGVVFKISWVRLTFGLSPPPDPLRRTAQNFALFVPRPPQFSFFLPLLGVLSLNFGGVFEGRDLEMCTFGPENSKRAHFRSPALQTPGLGCPRK